MDGVWWMAVGDGGRRWFVVELCRKFCKRVGAGCGGVGLLEMLSATFVDGPHGLGRALLENVRHMQRRRSELLFFLNRAHVVHRKGTFSP